MEITCDQLKAQELKRKYKTLLSDPAVFPTRNNWQYIIKNKMDGIGDLLFNKYIAACNVDDVDRADLHSIAIEEFPRYLGAVERSYAISVVYGNVRYPDLNVTLIRENKLFDATALKHWLEKGLTQYVLAVLDVYQPVYNEEDLNAMIDLLDCLEELPVEGYYERRQGLLGATMKYICPKGHVNDGNTVYCKHTDCGLNTRGLTEQQQTAFDTYAARVEALKSLM